LHDPVALPAWLDSADHLGWWEAADGTWTLGVPVPSGRVQGALRAALRDVVTRWGHEVRLTCRQDALLCGFQAEDRAAVDAFFAAPGVALVDALRPAGRYALAGPPLPACGRAWGEPERVIPRIIEAPQRPIDAAGLPAPDIRLNVPGCPNGCARPYTSEIG